MISSIPEEKLTGLSRESKECLQRLTEHEAPQLPEYVQSIYVGLVLIGSSGVVRQAAVLVILFQRPGDDKLSVVLTTRAKTLRYVLNTERG